MAIYGIGSKYGGQDEKILDFLKNGFAFIGYEENEAVAAFNAFKSTKVGDIIYVKGYSPNKGLFIKAVGIIKGRELVKDQLGDLGWGKKVDWLWTAQDGGHNFGILRDGMGNTRIGTFYEEFNPEIQGFVINKFSNSL